MKLWNELSMKEKHDIIRESVSKGIHSLDDIKAYYDNYYKDDIHLLLEGGDKDGEPEKNNTAALLDSLAGTPLDLLDSISSRLWSSNPEKARNFLIEHNLRYNEDAENLLDYFNSYVNSEGYNRILNNQYEWWKNRHPYRKWLTTKDYVLPLNLKKSVSKLAENREDYAPIYALDGHPEISFHRPNGKGTFVFKPVYINKNDSEKVKELLHGEKYPYPFVLAHEFAHRFNSGMNPAGTSGQFEALDQNQSTLKNKHDENFNEKHSDIWGLKYLLNHEGIYDSRSAEDITPELVEQLRKLYPKLRPLLLMDNEKAAWMLNHVAYNPTEHQDTPNITALGGPLVRTINKFYPGGPLTPYTPYLNDTPIEVAMKQLNADWNKSENRAATYNATHPVSPSNGGFVMNSDGSFSKVNPDPAINTMAEPVTEVASFMPVIGDAMYAGEVYDAAKQGNYGTAAVLAGLAALPNALEKPVKLVIKKTGLLDDAVTVLKELPLDENRYYRAFKRDALDSYKLTGFISLYDINGRLRSHYEVPMFTKGKPSLYRIDNNDYNTVWAVSKPEAKLEWESVKGLAVSPKVNGEFNKAPISDFDFYVYNPNKGYIKLGDDLTFPNGVQVSITPHIDYLKKLSKKDQIKYLTDNGLNDLWLWTLENNPNHLESALYKALIPGHAEYSFGGPLVHATNKYDGETQPTQQMYRMKVTPNTVRFKNISLDPTGATYNLPEFVVTPQDNPDNGSRRVITLDEMAQQAAMNKAINEGMNRAGNIGAAAMAVGLAPYLYGVVAPVVTSATSAASSAFAPGSAFWASPLTKQMMASTLGGETLNTAVKQFTPFNTVGEGLSKGVETVTGWNPSSTILGSLVMEGLNPGYYTPYNAAAKGINYAVNTAKIVDPKYRALHAYNSVNPTGYDNIVQRGTDWLLDMVQDNPVDYKYPKFYKDLIAQNKGVRPESGYTGTGDYIGEAVKNRGLIADEARLDAWAIHNGLEPQYGTYIRNSDGSWSYNMKNIIDKSEGTWYPSRLPLKTKTESIDFVTGAGGGLTDFRLVGKGSHGNGIMHLEDYWDVNPFKRKGDALSKRLFPNWDKRIGDKLWTKALNMEVYGVENPGTLKGKIATKLSRKLYNASEKPLFGILSPIDNAIKNFEIGTITGGKPFLMSTDIPFHKIDPLDNPDMFAQFMQGKRISTNPADIYKYGYNPDYIQDVKPIIPDANFKNMLQHIEELRNPTHSSATTRSNQRSFGGSLLLLANRYAEGGPKGKRFVDVLGNIVSAFGITPKYPDTMPTLWSEVLPEESYTELPTMTANQIEGLVAPLPNNNKDFIPDFTNIKTKDNFGYNIDNLTTAYHYFKDNMKLNDYQIASLLANGIAESGFDPKAHNPKTSAKGLYLWLDGRYKYSNNKMSDTELLLELLQYINDTLNNTEDLMSWHHGGDGSGYNKAIEAHDKFYNAKNLYDAVHSFTYGYNRPDSVALRVKQRYDLALKILERLLAKQHKNGGKIHIKPENRGKFTALKKRTGHSASWFKAHGTPALKKMAVFALNARKWKHDDGGFIDVPNLLLPPTKENLIYSGHKSWNNR